MTRLIVLSDLHLAGSGPLNSFHSGDALATFVRDVAFVGTTLVVNGDGFDLLQVPDRSLSLEMNAVPMLISQTLSAIRAEPWGRPLFDAFATLLEAGGRLVIIPGNHDVELLHPAARELLLREIAPLSGGDNLVVQDSGEPWETRVGAWDVILGHGHRGDVWNDVEPEAFRHALESGGILELPPGSRLVLQVLNRFKELRAPTGAPRFGFLDLLKPETPAVPLLLLYLEPKLALAEISRALGLSGAMLLRALRRRLTGGPVLGGAGPAGAESAAPSDAIASCIASGFTDAELKSPQFCMRQVEGWLEGRKAARENMLAVHGNGRFLLRAFLRSASENGTFFDRNHASPIDRGIIQSHLKTSPRPTVAIAGHTHAAREIHLDESRIYLNTGTWSDLMRLPRLATDEDVTHFVEAIELGQVPRLRRLTYAEVTADGPCLKELAHVTAQ